MSEAPDRLASKPSASNDPAKAGDGAHAAYVLWSSVHTALTLSCIRTYGQRGAAELEFEATRRDHEETLSTLGAVAPGGGNGPWRCADLHRVIDAARGGKPEVFEDSAARVWLRYRGPHGSAEGPFAPTAAPASLGVEIGQANARARFGVTAARIGGPGVGFVHTHDVTDGDAWDAGYFEQHAAAEEGARYRRVRGLPLPVVAASAAAPTTAGPRTDERGKRWASAAAWKMVVLGEQLGVVAGVAVVEHALRIVLTAYWHWLPGALGLPRVTTPLAAANLYAAAARLLGDEVTVTDYSGHALATRTRDRLWERHPHAPVALREALVRAWSATLPHHEWDLSARLAEPLVHGNPRATVRFDRGGPGD